MDSKLYGIGDSLTRYQYLSFVYWLHRARWRSPVPSNTWEQDWSSWKNFHLGTNARLGCSEICDCYRGGEMQRPVNVKAAFPKENRHYFDSQSDLMVRYYLWFPPEIPLRFAPIASGADIQKQCQTYDNANLVDYPVYHHNETSFMNMTEFLGQVVAPENPDVLIINYGFWEYPDASSVTGARLLAAAVRSASKRGMWKTTTPLLDNPGSERDSHVSSALDEMKLQVFDAHSYTKGISHHSKAYRNSSLL